MLISSIPPLSIDKESSGISFFKSTSFNTPIPLHFLQAPLGELNEKLLGSGNSYEIPDSSHIRFKLKYLASFESLSIIKIESFP